MLVELCSEWYKGMHCTYSDRTKGGAIMSPADQGDSVSPDDDLAARYEELQRMLRAGMVTLAQIPVMVPDPDDEMSVQEAEAANLRRIRCQERNDELRAELNRLYPQLPTNRPSTP